VPAIGVERLVQELIDAPGLAQPNVCFERQLRRVAQAQARSSSRRQFAAACSVPRTAFFKLRNLTQAADKHVRMPMSLATSTGP